MEMRCVSTIRWNEAVVQSNRECSATQIDTEVQLNQHMRTGKMNLSHQAHAILQASKLTSLHAQYVFILAIS